MGNSLVVRWLRLHVPNAGGLFSILGQGTRSHMLQTKSLNATTKRSCMSQWRSKILWVATKTQSSQIDKCFFKNGFKSQHNIMATSTASGNMMCVCVHAKSLQSCPTLCNPMDFSPSGSNVQGILQARILEWVAMPSSRRSSQPGDRTPVS